MFIDTHAHLDFSDFDRDRDDVIRSAKENEVGLILNVSSSLSGCRRSLELAHRYECIYASVGIHPHEVKEIEDSVFEQVKGSLSFKKVVAVGEVGLDFYRNFSPENIQKYFFRKFIEVSVTFGLPLIIHSRAAEEETLKILNDFSGKIRGVIHCFSGSGFFLERCLKLGLYISFTCNVTYKKSDRLRGLIREIPLDRLLLETDCPYLSPEGGRGKRNEPANIRILAEFIAALRKCAVEEIAVKTTENAKKLFKLA